MEPNSARQCRYTKSDGNGCQANVQAGSEFCFFHDPALVEERATARSEGGRERTRKVLLAPNTPIRELKTVTEVVQLLGETINQVRRGGIDLRVANCVGYLSGILLAALEKGQMEERLAALEAIIKSPVPAAPAEENYSFVFDGTTSEASHEHSETAGENPGGAPS